VAKLSVNGKPNSMVIGRLAFRGYTWKLDTTYKKEKKEKKKNNGS
jgi:hypothetical protein